jgi:hypothetical protein
VPVRVAEDGEFEALLANETLTEAKPLVWGVNVTVKFTLCPAGMVTGNDRPVTANSELPTLTDETVTPVPMALSIPV